MVIVSTALETALPIQRDQWDTVLTDGHASLVRARRVFRYLPSAPRCKVCNNPFGGPVGRLLAVAGFSPSRKNPNLCSRCCDSLPAGGSEVDVAVLFVDIRGSTALGQRGSSADFAALLNRFYIAATQTLLRHDAVIDKLIGDEVMAFFVRGISGPQYRRRAVLAGMELLKAVGYGSDEGPWRLAWLSMRASPMWATSGEWWSTSLPSVIRSMSRRGCNNTPPAGSCSSHRQWPMT
jgi:adenylate cyclase